MIPANSIALSADAPNVGLTVLKFVVTSKGNAPALILFAKSEASAAVKSPVIEHLPSEITEFTVGAEIMVSSIQIEIICPCKRSVASANF